jgi:ADP-ribose pyrophosphatase YjhB (NUDIX family)
MAEAAFARVSRGPGRRALVALLRSTPGRWLVAVAHRVLPTRQPIGVLAVAVDEDGRVLLVDHLTRVDHALGLPGGWLGRAERPEDGVRRELHEELGLRVTSTRYLLSAPHRTGEGAPYGLTLVFHAEVEGAFPAAASGEVMGSGWYALDAVAPRLREFEVEAIRAAGGR